MKELEQRVADWATADENVRAAAVVGSQARTVEPADRFSDLDVVLVVRDPRPLLETDDWVRDLGDVRVTFLEPTAVGNQLERRVLFADGADVDLAVVPVDAAQTAAEDADTAAVVARGIRVLVDKDGVLEELVAELPKPTAAPRPSEADFASAVADFWYHVVWAVKKLERGELYTAKQVVDGYLKRLVVSCAAWHAQAGRDVDTWHDGRFLERWADTRVLESLRAAYGRYERDDVLRALAATMDLFSWLARETAGRLGYRYDADAEQFCRETARGLLES